MPAAATTFFQRATSVAKRRPLQTVSKGNPLHSTCAWSRFLSLPRGRFPKKKEHEQDKAICLFRGWDGIGSHWVSGQGGEWCVCPGRRDGFIGADETGNIDAESIGQFEEDRGFE